MGKFFKRVTVGYGVADLDGGFQLFLIVDAGVDPHVAEFGGLLSFVRGHEVDGLLADDAGQGPFGGVDDDAAAGDYVRVEAAQRLELDDAVADRLHLEADLVDMAGQHDFPFAFLVQNGEAVAVRVAVNFVGHAFHFGAPNVPGAVFIARGAGSVQHFFQIGHA